MPIIIENPETGEVRTLEKDASGKYPSFRLPWKVKGTPQALHRQTVLSHVKMATQSTLAVYAQRLGLPVASFLDTARWLLDKDCPFCQTGTMVLRRIQELGEERAISFITRIQMAKANGDVDALNQIRQQIGAALRGEAVDGQR